MPGFKISGNGDGPSNMVETARKHRYQFTMIGPAGYYKCIYAYKSTRPTVEIDKITMHHGQDEIYMAGKERWHPIEITFYEAYEGTDTISSVLYQWRAQTVLHEASSNQGSQSSYKQTCTLQMLDGDGGPIWTYTMFDCWPSKVTPSDISYEESGIADIAVVLEVGKAKEG